ncbi:hypothetical protein KEM56_004532, partial [Ascosphaera pollenicola]
MTFSFPISPTTTKKRTTKKHATTTNNNMPTGQSPLKHHQLTTGDIAACLKPEAREQAQAQAQRTPLDVLSAAASNADRHVASMSPRKHDFDARVGHAAEEMLSSLRQLGGAPAPLGNPREGANDRGGEAKRAAACAVPGPGPVIEAVGAVAPDIIECLKKLQARGPSDFPDDGERTLAQFNDTLDDGGDDDDGVLFMYYALSCDFHFGPRFELVKEAIAPAAAAVAAADKGFTGVKLVDPEVSMTAWKIRNGDGDWKAVKAQACRYALRAWGRKHGQWVVPRVLSSRSSCSGVPGRFSELLL